MSATKQKILRKSVELFNEFGVAKVTTRQIAEGCGIAHGNLTYHFASKPVIIETIYKQMYNFDHNLMYDGKAAGFPEPAADLDYLAAVLDFIYDFEERYLFFYVDLIEVVRICPDIRREITANYDTRKETFSSIIADIRRAGLLTGELKGERLGRLVETIILINTFWLSGRRVYLPGHPASTRRATFLKVWHLIGPYVTGAGLKSYRRHLKG